MTEICLPASQYWGDTFPVHRGRLCKSYLLFSLFLFTETDIRPRLFLGTSFDHIGPPASEQAYFLTATKRLPYLPLSVYGTVNYSEWDDELNFPFSAIVDFGKGFSVRGMFDEKESHLMFNYFYKQHGVSLMYIWFETFGVAMSTAFLPDLFAVTQGLAIKKGKWTEPFA